MTLTSKQHDIFYEHIKHRPEDNTGGYRPFDAEVDATVKAIKRCGYTYDYDNKDKLKVPISYEEVEAATGHRHSLHAVIKESGWLTSNYSFIPPNNEEGLKPVCTRYSFANWQTYCQFERAGVTDVKNRYSLNPDKQAAKKEGGQREVLKVDGRETNADVLKQLSGPVTISERAFEQMLSELDQMRQRVEDGSEFAHVAHGYRSARSIADQTVDVSEGKRTVHLSHTEANTGRVYTRRSTFQNLLRVDKARLLDGYNYDIKSCHDSILRFLFDRYDVDLPDWPDKDDVDLPNELVKPLSHAIKQTGTRQIPHDWKGVYRGYKSKCDVATMIWDYVEPQLTIDYDEDSEAALKELEEVMQPVLDKLHEAYGELEAGLQELEYKLETAPHPLGLEKKKKQKTLAHHLQGWEAVVMRALALRDPGTVLLDHDGYITQSPPEKVQEYWDETVPAEIADYLELVEKPIAKESDEAKRREILGREPREANTQEEKANTPSRKERPTKRRSRKPSRRTRQSRRNQGKGKSTLKQAVGILSALPTREARRLLLKAAPEANGMVATLPVNRQPGYENSDEIRALFEGSAYRYVTGGFKAGRLKDTRDRYGHDFSVLQSALKKHTAEELLDMTAQYVETGEIKEPESKPARKRKRKRSRKRSRTRTRTNREPKKRSRPSPKERERKRAAELEYAREVVAST